MWDACAWQRKLRHAKWSSFPTSGRFGNNDDGDDDYRPARLHCRPSRPPAPNLSRLHLRLQVRQHCQISHLRLPAALQRPPLREFVIASEGDVGVGVGAGGLKELQQVAECVCLSDCLSVLLAWSLIGTREAALIASSDWRSSQCGRHPSQLTANNNTDWPGGNGRWPNNGNQQAALIKLIAGSQRS